MINKLACHPIACHLVLKLRELVSDMTLNTVAPKNIVTSLKWKIPLSVSNIKQIYNVDAQNNKAARRPISEMQPLLKLLEDDTYVSRYRVYENKVTARDIFWSHPDSIKLLITFPIVIIIDSTYKTNKYKIRLLEIVGVTSTKMVFSVGFAILESEKEENVTWALEMCKTILKNQENVPQVTIINRNTTLMNFVCHTVFDIVRITL